MSRQPVTSRAKRHVELCQALGPAAPYPIKGLDCATGRCGELGWNAARPINWQRYAQGEYVGHERLAHVAHYRLRVDDDLAFVYRLTREETATPYQLNVGDEVRVESVTDPLLNRDLVIQPDGSITLRLLGQVRATRRTVAQLREEVEHLYEEYYKTPAITITPLRVNTRLEDLRATVDSRFGFGGQSRLARVTPEGTIQLPAVGSVPAQGLTLDELKRELDERYARFVDGMEITPVLTQRAARYVYVVGEVKTPGRYELTGPTTAMQSISLAGGWNYGGNLWNVVVFRRGDDWRLLATRLDLRGPLYGKRPCPADEIWLNDSDIVVVPKTGILVANNVIDLLFTHGLYGIVPFNTVTSFSITKFGALH
ncbi:MAG TPA: polysaccharide biosynthesis/export family protein [Pirellulales bacterium]|nr:polysaccharide biosynthesis/export family protein [Pirellulales bacterium]